MHHHHSTNALFTFFGRVQQRVTFVQYARINSSKSERSNKRVVHNFEGQRRERHSILCTPGNISRFSFIAGFKAHIIDDIHRRWQIVDHSVKQWLHAFVLECRSAKNWNELNGQCTSPDQTPQSWNVRLVTVHQILFHLIVVHFDSDFDHLGAPLVCLLFQTVTNWAFLPACAKVLAGPNPLFHGNQIDHAFQLVLGTNRNLYRTRRSTCPVFNHMDAIEKISSDFVHFIYKHNPRHLVPISLAPHSLSLRLDSGICIENSNRSVKNSQRPFNFNRKVHVPGCVDDVHPVLRCISSRPVFGPLPKRRGRS